MRLFTFHMLGISSGADNRAPLPRLGHRVSSAPNASVQNVPRLEYSPAALPPMLPARGGMEHRFINHENQFHVIVDQFPCAVNHHMVPDWFWITELATGHLYTDHASISWAAVRTATRAYSSCSSELRHTQKRSTRLTKSVLNVSGQDIFSELDPEPGPIRHC